MPETYSVPPVLTKQEILDRARTAVMASYSNFDPYQIISWEGKETFYIWRRYDTGNSYELKTTWEVLRIPRSLTEAFDEISRYMSWEDNAVEMEEGAQ